MQGLKKLKLIDAIKQFAYYDRPFLGICLGMQMMLSSSEEFGVNKGLNFVPGVVKSIPPIDTNGKPT